MSFKNWSSDAKAIASTASIAAALMALAIYSFLKVWPDNRNGWMILFGLAAGGIGGIFHELAQSGGKLLLPKREADGFYLGGLTGTLMGMLAGVLAVQGLFAALPPANPTPAPSVNASTTAVTPAVQPASNHAPSAPQSPVAIQALYAALLAGLALKGVAEAATGQSVNSSAGPLPANARIPIDLPPHPTPPKLS